MRYSTRTPSRAASGPQIRGLGDDLADRPGMALVARRPPVLQEFLHGAPSRSTCSRRTPR
ncbi:MAG: hypothetical protein WKF75_08240 [Singulisphaera sp.]